MRQFLTSETANSLRVHDRNGARRSSLNIETRSISKAGSSKSALARSLSRGRSDSLRDATPPITPIKSEPHDTALPPRQYDSMEMVIERQRRQSRKEKKSRMQREKEREPVVRAPMPQQPPSPSPKTSSQIGVSLDSFMQSRADHRVGGPQPDESAESDDALPIIEVEQPVTPQKNSYYREHTNLGSTARKRPTSAQDDSPTPTRTRPNPLTTNPYLKYGTYPQLPFQALQASSSAQPVTPQTRRVHPSIRQLGKSPALPSSSPPPSSPFSSPARRIVNLVSSPGPMGPEPQEEEYDTLPYTLPPGPYSPTKPDLSYAALVGQAILSSPEHRLTLQEIYDWITIVYPHFKRGETTWMNSIRHVLSTTICFRKVPRDRSVGRTQWAIWDEDLECFKGGGFRKQLCKDIMNANSAKEKLGSGPRGKPRARKRVDGEDDVGDTRKTKKGKKDHALPTFSVDQAPYIHAPLVSHPLFPPTRPTPHHQPYYESCLPQPQPIPADLIFPPLPAAAAFNQVRNANAATSSSTVFPTTAVPDATEALEGAEVASSPEPQSLAPPSSSEASSSVPELTPNNSSSSPPLSLGSEDADKGGDQAKTSAGDEPSIVEEEEQVALDGEKDTLPAPAPASKPPKRGKGLMQAGSIVKTGGISKASKADGKKKRDKGKNKVLSFASIPASPTYARKGGTKKSSKTSPTTGTTSARSGSPSTMNPMLSTPPRSGREAKIAEHQSENDGEQHGKEDHEDDGEGLRTPLRRNAALPGGEGAPVTPRKLVFPSNPGDSPFRTPLGVLDGSPFRTPGSRTIFDPHDPRTLLDEELSRMGAGQGESPGGLFGKGMGSLLYDSPGALDSPGKWTRWW